MIRTLSRRDFMSWIGSGAVAWALTVPAWSSAQPDAAKMEARKAVLDTVLDTMIPADDTPGAREAGVAHLIDAMAETNAALRHYLNALLDEVERAAMARDDQPFTLLPLTTRESILREVFASSDEERREARTGFMMLRGDVFAFYYLSDAGRATLGYETPFPRGYPDYAAALEPRP